jgi:hypothetical protein
MRKHQRKTTSSKYHEKNRFRLHTQSVTGWIWNFRKQRFSNWGKTQNWYILYIYVINNNIILKIDKDRKWLRWIKETQKPKGKCKPTNSRCVQCKESKLRRIHEITRSVLGHCVWATHLTQNIKCREHFMEMKRNKWLSLRRQEKEIKLSLLAV